MPIKKSLKQLFTNIKTWGWYQWVKYLLATLCFGLGTWLMFACLFLAFSDLDMAIFLLFVSCFLVLPIYAISWLVIKDFKLPHIILILISLCYAAMSLQLLGVYHDNYPRLVDIVLFAIIAMSGVCLCKLATSKNTNIEMSNLSSFSYVFAGLWGLFMVLIGGSEVMFPDFKDMGRKECIENKVAKGYPRDFARQYCLGDGDGCIEKEYDKDCQVGVKCCFATIEEDKKWNYLEYDEQGNKIAK